MRQAGSTQARMFVAVLGALTLAHAIAPTSAQEAPAAQKKLYCWNENGRRFCGDALPPEQAAGARTEFSAKSGRTLKQIQRALTAEERATAAAAAREAQLQHDTESSRVRRDLAMVESYATEADLQRAFSERIVLVEESIKTSLLSEANLRRGLVGLLNQASNLELTGKPVARPLHDNILKQHSELGRQLQILRDQRADRAALDSELAGALQRYRDLKRANAGETASIAPAETGGTP